MNTRTRAIAKVRKKYEGRGMPGLDTIAVRRRKFANILIKRGHRILGITQNRMYPKQSVYIFENTYCLQNDLTKLINGEYLG